MASLAVEVRQPFLLVMVIYESSVTLIRGHRNILMMMK